MKHIDNFCLQKNNLTQPYTILGHNNKKGCNKKYYIKCSECARDYDLFDEGIFKITKSRLIGGEFCCACSRSFRYSEKQRDILTKRKSEEYDVNFIKILGKDYNGYITNKLKIECECPNHGVYHTLYGNFMKRGKGCKKCTLMEENEVIGRLNKTLKFKNKLTFKDSNTRKNNKKVYEVRCDTCSNDEYVDNNLCSGVFLSKVSDLLEGSFPCRCSKGFSWTKEQYEYKIVKEDCDYEFKGWVGSKSFKLFHKKCKEEFVTDTSSWLHMKSRCASCWGKNTKQFYINEVYDKGEVLALKVGISVCWNKRLNQLQNGTNYKLRNILSVEFDHYEDCRAFENYIKSKFKQYFCFLTKEQIRSGYTETITPNLKDILVEETLKSRYKTLVNCIAK